MSVADDEEKAKKARQLPWAGITQICKRGPSEDTRSRLPLSSLCVWGQCAGRYATRLRGRGLADRVRQPIARHSDSRRSSLCGVFTANRCHRSVRGGQERGCYAIDLNAPRCMERNKRPKPVYLVELESRCGLAPEVPQT